MGRLDDLIRAVGARAPESLYAAGRTGPHGFDIANADDVLRRAVVEWKGSPSKIGIHVRDELNGLGLPTSATGLRSRAMAAALLDAVDTRSVAAPPLYRGDILPPEQNPSPLIGWTARPEVAQHWASTYGGSVYPLEGAKGLRLQDVVGDMFDDGEEEWIVRRFGPATRPDEAIRVLRQR